MAPLETSTQATPDGLESNVELAIADCPLVLTAFVASDVSTLVDADNDPEFRRRFGFPDSFVPSPAHARQVLARWEQERSAGTRFTFAVRDRIRGVLLGGCELQRRPDGSAHVSYWTYPAHRNKGIASRAVALLMAEAFETFSFTRLELLTDSDNHASRRVALRNGFAEAGSRGDQVLHVAENPHSKP